MASLLLLWVLAGSRAAGGLSLTQNHEEVCTGEDFGGDIAIPATSSLLQTKESKSAAHVEQASPTASDPVLYELSTRVSSKEAQTFVEQLLIHPKLVSPEVQSLSCDWGACTVNGPVTGEAGLRSGRFLEEARKGQPVTDKVTAHSYQTMYGAFLLPSMDRPGAKFLEIGLGCDMNYGPGASVALWKRLFRSDAEIWEADFNGECVKSGLSNGMLEGIKPLVGDQGNKTTVEAWLAETGGQLDAIIDDGGHHNNQILTSFETLWPAVKPGGLYAMEDLQVGRRGPYYEPQVQRIVIADLVKGWIHQLATQRQQGDWPLPQDISAIFCQREACLIRKSVGQPPNKDGE